MKKVLVAMSGGVDSSVAAYLLQEQGYECIGVTMRLYENDTVGINPRHTCCSLDDVDDARSVAFQLGIDYHVFDFSDEFEEKVIKKFVESYEKGLTPNPCIDCNRYLKFDHLLQRAEDLGCDYIATGHYAQVYQDDEGRYRLKKGVDDHKDQTYALYNFDQEILSKVLLPVGALTKEEVREIAEKAGFINAKKHDSQDICFVPDGDYVAFLERYTKNTYPSGKLVNKEGEVLGDHKGAISYTIGQRRGLGLAMPEPMYVYDKDMAKNEVSVGPESSLYSTSLIADDWNWVMSPRACEFSAKAKVRYGAKEVACKVKPLEEGLVQITFDEAVRAIAPGQAAVVYIENEVVGGGRISQVLRDDKKN